MEKRISYFTSWKSLIGTAGKDEQGIKAGDVVIIHDDFPRINWKLASCCGKADHWLECIWDYLLEQEQQVQKLTDPSSGYSHWRSMRMRIRMNSLQTLLQQMPWTRWLVWFHTNGANLQGRLATTAACRKVKEWTDVLHAALEDVIV